MKLPWSFLAVVALSAGCSETQGEPPTCPDELYEQPPVVVEYYGESGVLPRDTHSPTEGFVFVEATWEYVRRLEVPYEQRCADNFVTDPPSLPCSVETVIGILPDGEETIEILVGIPADELEKIPSGILVRYSLTPPNSHDVYWGLSLGLNLVVESPESGQLLLAAMGYEPLGENQFQHDFGQLTVSRDSKYICGYKMYMDCKHYGVTAIVVTSDKGNSRVKPGESADVSVTAAKYRVTHRRGKDRTCFPDYNCCGDLELDHYSYSIVRIE